LNDDLIVEVDRLRAELAQRTAERDALEAESFALSAEISRVRLVEVAKANAERDKAVDALKRIATYDYRGNQSGESQIARHALIAMRKEGGVA
jgi:hypothetical protein